MPIPQAILDQHPDADPRYLARLFAGLERASEAQKAAMQSRYQRDRGLHTPERARALVRAEAAESRAFLATTFKNAVDKHMYYLEDQERRDEEANDLLSQGVGAFEVLSKVLSPLSAAAAWAYREGWGEMWTESELERIAGALPPSLHGQDYKKLHEAGLSGLHPGRAAMNAFSEVFADTSPETALHAVAMGELEVDEIDPFQAEQAIAAQAISRESAPPSSKVLAGFAGGAGTLVGFAPHMAGLRGTSKLIGSAVKRAQKEIKKDPGKARRGRVGTGERSRVGGGGTHSRGDPEFRRDWRAIRRVR